MNLSNCFELRSLGVGIFRLTSLVQLDISHSSLTGLPKALSGLCSLTSLVLYDCVDLTSLGNGIRGLDSLRHLDIRCCSRLRSLPKGISRLQNLGVFR